MAERESTGASRGLGAACGAALVGAILFSSAQNPSPGHAAPPTSTSREASHQPNAIVSATTTRAIGEASVTPFIGVVEHDGGSGTLMDICVSGGAITSIGHAKSTTLAELNDTSSSDKAGAAPCELKFDNIFSNTAYDNQVSGQVGGIFEGTLEGNGSDGTVTGQLKQIAKAGTVQ